MSSVVMQHEPFSAEHHQGHRRLGVPHASMVVRAFSRPSEAGDRDVVLAVPPRSWSPSIKCSRRPANSHTIPTPTTT
jgi:hypothetical protein